MKATSLFPMVSLLCALTFAVGCSEAPPPVEPTQPEPVTPLTIARTFTTALFTGDTETIATCVVAEDVESAKSMARMWVQTGAELETTLADLDERFAQCSYEIDGDKAYITRDGLREELSFVKDAGEWKIDLPVHEVAPTSRP